MTAPAAGPAPEAKKEEVKAEAGRAGGANDTLLSKVPEKIVSGSWAAIKGISRYTWQLIRGVVGGTVYGSAGTGLGTLVDTAKTAGGAVKDIEHEVDTAQKETAESRHIAKLGPIIGGIAMTTWSAVANTLKWPFKLIKGGAMRVAEGGARIVDAVMGKYDQNKQGREATRQEEASAAHAAGAHPA